MGEAKTATSVRVLAGTSALPCATSQAGSAEPAAVAGGTETAAAMSLMDPSLPLRGGRRPVGLHGSPLGWMAAVAGGHAVCCRRRPAYGLVMMLMAWLPSALIRSGAA